MLESMCLCPECNKNSATSVKTQLPMNMLCYSLWDYIGTLFWLIIFNYPNSIRINANE